MKRDRSALIAVLIFIFFPENLLLNQGCVTNGGVLGIQEIRY
jgi:hypothetical protein